MNRVKFFVTFLSGCAVLLFLMFLPTLLSLPLSLMLHLDSKGSMEFSSGEVQFFESAFLVITILFTIFTGAIASWGLINLCEWYGKVVHKIGMPFDVNLRFQYFYEKYCGE